MQIINKLKKDIFDMYIMLKSIDRLTEIENDLDELEDKKDEINDLSERLNSIIYRVKSLQELFLISN